MESKLMIIRGNSGSGKTTIAHQLQMHLGNGTLHIEQDIILKEMLHLNDTPHNLAIDFIKQIALYGKQKCPLVILEGTFNTKRYGNMLMELIEAFEGNYQAYYFDLPFDEALHRQQLRQKSGKFRDELKFEYWIEKDYLPIIREKILTKELTENHIVDLLLQDFRES